MLTSARYSAQVFCNPFITCYVLYCVTQSDCQSLKSPTQPIPSPAGGPASALTEKTKDYTLTYFNFHFSSFKTSPPSLTFIFLLTACLLFKACLFISPAQLPSPGHCSITLICILNIFLSVRFITSACKHNKVTSNTEKKKKKTTSFLSSLQVDGLS